MCTAKYENFSKAAEELHVTSTAISHQISNLEEWFGVELFKKKWQERDADPNRT
ncbi:LysR family transcriptional regulator [Vibrio sp. M60_M31a]